MLELSTICQSVQADLDKVEERLRSVIHVDFSHLSELLDFSLKSTGKRIRPILTLLSGKFYDYNPEHLLTMAAAVEILHAATLVHDDAIDNSLVRRGQPTVYSKWGVEKAVLLGERKVDVDDIKLFVASEIMEHEHRIPGIEQSFYLKTPSEHIQ